MLDRIASFDFVFHFAVSGHVLAFYNLAVMHASGTGVLRSCNTATEVSNTAKVTLTLNGNPMLCYTEYSTIKL